MNNEMRDVINSLAEDILSKYNFEAPISDMTQVVESLGGIVEINDVMGFAAEGMLRRDKDSEAQFIITVPAYESEGRTNFTIAHELGHLFLHMGYLINDELWKQSANVAYYRSGNSEQENQANEFAAAFLMPAEEYKKAVRDNTEGNKVNISKIADYFKVSVEAAAYRGKWLGLLQW